MKCSLCQQEKEQLICQVCQECVNTNIENIDAIIKTMELLMKTPASFRKARIVENELLDELKKLRSDWKNVGLV